MDVNGLYRPAPSAESAAWIVAGTHGFGESVLSLLPAGFEAYVRIFHPAYNSDGDRQVPVRWSEIAAANGRRVNPAMQLCSLTGDHRHEYEGQPGVFDQAPSIGEPPEEILLVLADVLARHTTSAQHCYWAVWEGYGAMPAWVRRAPAFEIPNRRFQLMTAPIHILAQSVEAGQDGEFPWWQPANLWWPADRAWCVATEIDFNSTYLGLSEQGAADLLAQPGLEAVRANPDDGIAYDSDPFNPAAHDDE